jgi:hypothetical protein
MLKEPSNRGIQGERVWRRHEWVKAILRAATKENLAMAIDLVAADCGLHSSPLTGLFPKVIS